ncbi:amidoligase family protein [Tissierella creatinophila]|uniref:Putative amidoligase enzyme n=1 Tax=Tissierella creatinophila DSM 6911 TaxID=1123403 RepID=A0A1U7M5N9_TISCR|nr:amidoligase family protein [Tissierella creatinophila]OLS02570.1 putative amidoligase enzyme [Tissierella creatinophila DSM 6911]
MLTRNFGIEIEFTGITREKAARVIRDHLQGLIIKEGSSFKVADAEGRSWQIVYDGSLRNQRKTNGQKVPAGREYSVELVSPILKYEKDIDSLQEMVRKLRGAGAFVNSSCGIHIHLNGKDHTSRSLRNFVNIIYSRNDLLYTSLEIKSERVKYCKKMDQSLVENMNKKKPTSFKEIEDIWYQGYYEGRSRHYHNSRYHFLNLHSFFNGVGTVELRGFNGTLHAGKIRSFILLSLAMNNQALTQKFASSKKPQLENPKFAMRTWLNRIGFIGKDYKNPREHLCKHLEGSGAWRFKEQA